jgi:hypothetical protein
LLGVLGAARVVHRHRRAVISQPLGSRRANPLGGAGDQRAASRKWPIMGATHTLTPTPTRVSQTVRRPADRSRPDALLLQAPAEGLQAGDLLHRGGGVRGRLAPRYRAAGWPAVGRAAAVTGAEAAAGPACAADGFTRLAVRLGPSGQIAGTSHVRDASSDRGSRPPPPENRPRASSPAGPGPKLPLCNAGMRRSPSANGADGCAEPAPGPVGVATARYNLARAAGLRAVPDEPSVGRVGSGLSGDQCKTCTSRPFPFLGEALRSCPTLAIGVRHASSQKTDNPHDEDHDPHAEHPVKRAYTRPAFAGHAPRSRAADRPLRKAPERRQRSPPVARQGFGPRRPRCLQGADDDSAGTAARRTEDQPHPAQGLRQAARRRDSRRYNPSILSCHLRALGWHTGRQPAEPFHHRGSHRHVSHGHVSHGHVSHGHVSHGHVSHGHVSHDSTAGEAVSRNQLAA